MTEKLRNAHETQRLVYAMMACYPSAESELRTGSLFQFLCAVVLSAQTTDAAVNKATPALFAAYPTPKAMAKASPSDIEPYIQTIGLYRNKAKFLSGLAQRLVDTFDGEVPKTRKDLESLPGVGRKTASVMLSAGFGEPAFAVDTHIKRLCRKFRFAPAEAKEREIERLMCEKLPPNLWHRAHHSILLFGRYQCVARKHDHKECLARLEEHLPTAEALAAWLKSEEDGGHAYRKPQ